MPNYKIEWRLPNNDYTSATVSVVPDGDQKYKVILPDNVLKPYGWNPRDRTIEINKPIAQFDQFITRGDDQPGRPCLGHIVVTEIAGGRRRTRRAYKKTSSKRRYRRKSRQTRRR